MNFLLCMAMSAITFVLIGVTVLVLTVVHVVATSQRTRFWSFFLGAGYLWVMVACMYYVASQAFVVHGR